LQRPSGEQADAAVVLADDQAVPAVLYFVHPLRARERPRRKDRDAGSMKPGGRGGGFLPPALRARKWPR
jgi:hypothetical protein